jgi:SanA protein
MLRKTAKILLRGLLLILLAGLVVFGLPYLVARGFAAERIYTIETAPGARVAIVFGAGLQRNGTPTPILRDRIETAVNLYKAGKVDKLLMSGDNRFVSYNEPAAMQNYAAGLGVPEKDIVLDFAGRRTYDTCYRARHIFGVQEAILITQQYHLPRALITCNNLGLKANGIPADNRRYRRSAYAFWVMREVPATTVALWEVWVSRPLPVLGKPEPIFNTTLLNSPFQ